MRLPTVIALLAAAPAVPTAAAQQPALVAVYDMTFYGRGANSLEAGDPEAADAGSAVLRARLGGAGTFRLVEQAALRQALAEREARDGQPCTTLRCRREVAAPFGARYIVTSKLSKTSNLIWLMTGQITEVGSGRMLTDEEFELKGRRDDSARMGADYLARRFLRAADVAARGIALGPTRFDETYANGISATDRARIEPLHAALRDAIETQDGERILPWARFPASARALEPGCDAACLREEAHASGARWLLLPRAKKISALVWQYEATLVDVESGRTAGYDEVELKGGPGPRLNAIAAAQLATRLLRLAGGTGGAPSPAAGGR